MLLANQELMVSVRSQGPNQDDADDVSASLPEACDYGRAFPVHGSCFARLGRRARGQAVTVTAKFRGAVRLLNCHQPAPLGATK